MQDESIGDLEQPSQLSDFYYHGVEMEGLVVVGRQIPIHDGQERAVNNA